MDARRSGGRRGGRRQDRIGVVEERDRLAGWQPARASTISGGSSVLGGEPARMAASVGQRDGTVKRSVAGAIAAAVPWAGGVGVCIQAGGGAGGATDSTCTSIPPIQPAARL